MLSVDDVLAARSGKAYDSEGEKIGSVGEVYLDDQSGQPAWVTVNTGLFGTSESFIPLEGARLEGEDLHLPYTKAKIKDAPRQDADKHLDVEQEEALYRYYGLTQGGSADTQGRNLNDRDAAVAGGAGQGIRDERNDRDYADTDRRDFSDTDRRDDNEGMVRHEERVNVGTERRDAGQARLRKYVVTEQQSVDVPVTHEEAHLTREPMNERAAAGTKLGEDTQSVTLHDERPVVEKETVAVERVGLDVDQVQSTERVQTEVSHEEIELERGEARDGNEKRSLADKARDFKDKH